MHSIAAPTQQHPGEAHATQLFHNRHSAVRPCISHPAAAWQWVNPNSKSPAPATAELQLFPYLIDLFFSSSSFPCCCTNDEDCRAVFIGSGRCKCGMGSNGAHPAAHVLCPRGKRSVRSPTILLCKLGGRRRMPGPRDAEWHHAWPGSSAVIVCDRCSAVASFKPVAVYRLALR